MNNKAIIETERLYLREMTHDDFDALCTVLCDSDIMQHYPYTFDQDRVKRWIELNIERYTVFGFGLWAVCLKDTGRMIGDCGLTIQNINEKFKPEIGYHIMKAMQRKGYAKEAAGAVMDWAYANTPFKRLYSYMNKTNTPSSATAQSIGMKFDEEYINDEGEITCVFSKGKDYE